MKLMRAELADDFSFCETLIMRNAILIVLAFGLGFSSRAFAHEPLCPAPEQLGNFDFATTAFHAHFEGTTAYVLIEDQVLVLVDIADPANMTEISSVQLPVFSTWIDAIVHADTLYIFDYNSFVMVDISDQQNPVFVGEFVNPFVGTVNRASIHNDYLYLKTTTTRRAVIDLADPHSPAFISFEVSGPRVLCEINGVVYSDRLEVLDMSDPSNPVATTPTITSALSWFHVDGEVLIGFGLFSQGQMFDLSDPLNPENIGDIDSMYINQPQYFGVIGSLVYGANYSNPDIVIADISNFDSSYTVATYDLLPDGIVLHLTIINGVVYILDNHSLQAYALTPKPVSASRRTQGPLNDVVLAGDLAILAMDGGAIEILDISNSANPVLLSRLEMGELVNAVAIKGTIAYVAAGRENLNIVDFSDSANPVLIGNIDTGRRARDAVVVGDLLYFVDRIEGLSIFDISEPTSPLLLSVTNTIGWSDDILIDDDRKIAYYTHGRNDLLILDVSDPTQPVSIGSIKPLDFNDDGLMTTTLHDGLLYTAEGNLGYRIFDVSDPTAPIELAAFDVVAATDDGNVFGFTHQLVFDGSDLIVANGTGGVIRYDATDPMNPIQTDWVQTRSGSEIASVRRMVQRGDQYFSAVYEGGFRVYDFGDCPDCPADLNGDGIVDFFDVSVFLSAFNAHNPIADLTADGIYDFFDISAFLQFYASGCP